MKYALGELCTEEQISGKMALKIQTYLIGELSEQDGAA